MRPRLESLTFRIGNQQAAAIRQRDPKLHNAPKLLCVHGWLDNANSFMPLMPYLPALDLVAIDLPGCGYSDPLAQGYGMQELCYQIHRILDALDWKQCHLVGHSLGGGVAATFAALCPEMIQSLIMIDSAGPLSEEADKLPMRMRRALHDRLNAHLFESRVFANKEAAITTRLRSATMYESSARLIIERQLNPVEGGYRWRFDPRWRHTSWQYNTEAQVQSVLAAVSCKALTILAKEGYLTRRPHTEDRLSCLRYRQNVILAGNHHLHMDTPEPVAATINQFLDITPDLGGWP